MKKSVGVAELKARLSEYLREARRGRTVTVLDRGTPVAELVPVTVPDPLQVRAPSVQGRRLAGVPVPGPLRLPIDPVALLLEDRESGR
jgi:prevent-host-death family protein